MDTKNSVIRLYAAQSQVVIDVIERDGVCYSKEEYVRKKYQESAKIFTTAYSWYVKNAVKYAPKPEGAEYPYWAFSKQIYVDRSGGGRFLTLDVPKEEVVLFDSGDWNKILNLEYLAKTPEEKTAFVRSVEQMGTSEMNIMLSSFYPIQKRQIQDSWQNLFRYHEELLAKAADSETSETGSAALAVSNVQAGLWRIKKEWIVDMI